MIRDRWYPILEASKLGRRVRESGRSTHATP